MGEKPIPPSHSPVAVAEGSAHRAAAANWTRAVAETIDEKDFMMDYRVLIFLTIEQFRITAAKERREIKRLLPSRAVKPKASERGGIGYCVVLIVSTSSELNAIALLELAVRPTK
jgi:hypothetical protein